MLVQMDSPSGRTSNIPSIMDSPTLVRVERAMLRHEEGSHRDTASFNRTAVTQSLISGNCDIKSGYHAIKRGLLWQQRDRLFSRWKERYFVLTRDYLHCFRRASGTDRVSEMGQFLFKIKLVEVERIEWLNKKTYSTVSLELGRDGKILLRAGDGLEDWFELLEECMLISKERRRALKFSHDIEKRINNNSINSSLEEWVMTQQKIPNNRALPMDTINTDSNSKSDDTVSVRKRERNWKSELEETNTWTLQDTSNNRLSLLTDIDISLYDGTMESPSVSSHRPNQNTYCISGSERINKCLTNEDNVSNRGSFRSVSKTPVTSFSGDISTKKTASRLDAVPQLIKYRERSHSDIQKIDRRQWKLCTSIERTTLFN